MFCVLLLRPLTYQESVADNLYLAFLFREIRQWRHPTVRVRLSPLRLITPYDYPCDGCYELFRVGEH